MELISKGHKKDPTIRFTCKECGDKYRAKVSELSTGVDRNETFYVATCPNCKTKNYLTL